MFKMLISLHSVIMEALENDNHCLISSRYPSICQISESRNILYILFTNLVNVLPCTKFIMYTKSNFFLTNELVFATNSNLLILISLQPHIPLIFHAKAN